MTNFTDRFGRRGVIVPTMRKILLASLGVLVASAAVAAPQIKELVRNSKFFKVEVKQKHINGTTDYVTPALRLDLSSLATDQPQYWPNEKVHVKVMALQRGGQTLEGTWQKRDAGAHKFDVKVNADGIAVIEIMDGGKAKLELGEYRVDLKSTDKKTNLSTTFTIVDGALGAVSFAHEWKRVTTIGDLENSKGGWFLGNPGGAGQRWGNGLSFKNELRAANAPYNGEATINSRCMLPGCNGTFAGPTMKVMVKDGKIEGTLGVGGHSGPFQIELVTNNGSLRHQFEGSSHVEREMLTVAGGVGWTHRVSLAPYENTKQIPGRQLYVESKKTSADDAFEIDSISAHKGQAQITIKKATKSARIVAWSPKADGTYAPKEIQPKGDLAAGQKLTVAVAAPYSLVTIGGFVDGKFKEGWALVFAPSQLEVTVEAPASGAPNKPVQITVHVKNGAKATGILEVYDNRVASKSSINGLASAIGDSVRSTSRAVASWRDTTGLVDEDGDGEEDPSPRKNLKSKDKKEESKSQAPSSLGSMGMMGKGSGGGGTGSGYGYGMGSIGARSSAAPMPMKMARPSPSSGGGAHGGRPDEDDVAKEIIREGEKKMVFCQLVETDASGKATITATLPPQTGRVTARFVAAKGLDHGEGQTSLDVKLGAYADARLPRVIIPGAEFKLKIDVSNNLSEPVNLIVKGTGVANELRKSIRPGQSIEEVGLLAKESGKLIVQLTDSKGKALDRRELAVTLLDDQTVTYSRLEFGGGQQGVTVGANEEVVVYDGAGPLLKGIVMNVFTTTESWFGHAEALSAKVAVHSVLLAAIDKGLLDDDGQTEQIRSTLNASVRALYEKFFDKAEGLVRPYPGLPLNPLWSAWTTKNLHAAIRALDKSNRKDQRVAEAYVLCKDLAARIDAALKKKSFSLEEVAGINDGGEAVIPVEIDGKVVYRVLTDDAVTKWAMDKLLPVIDFDAKSNELAFSKAYDTFRFLKAFERTGALQYQTEIATALYLKGERVKFAQLYRHITRGMILTQEPGLLQGPALLGGVYSTPMALVKFLELQLVIGAGRAKDKPTMAGRSFAFGDRIKGGGTLAIPAGAIARVDKQERIRWDSPPVAGQSSMEWAQARVSAPSAKVGEELGLEIALSSDLDPMEYYAIVAVPSTVAIKQTEDILADYRGTLIYGQQVTGGTRMQLLAIPFRGNRSMKLVLEGAYPGRSFGKVAIRHIEKSDGYSVRSIPEIAVQ